MVNAVTALKSLNNIILFQEKENEIMKKWVCTVCGYVHEGETAPAECPVCHAPAEKFQEQSGEMTWAAEHVVGCTGRERGHPC